MKRLAGKEQEPLEAAELEELRERYDHCLVDVGTGDGRFVLHAARERPDTLCIGLDAVAEAMTRTAQRARRRPQKGGAGNALFVVAAAERLPGPLEGLADAVTVNFPWGSLLRALVAPEVPVLRRLAAVGRPGAELTVLINLSVFEDPDYLQRLGLPVLDDARLEALSPAYRQAGILLDEVKRLGPDSPHHTSWGQRLVRGAARHTLLIAGNIARDGAADAPS